MLPKYCRKFTSHKSNRRQPTYSSLSRYQRSMRHRFDDAQHSPSISVSDEQQRLTHIALTKANFCEPNGFAKSQKGREGRPNIATTIRETVGCQDYTRRVSRDSDCSQLTTITSLSKQGLNNEGNNNANECLLRIHKSPKGVTLGSVYLHLCFANLINL